MWDKYSSVFPSIWIASAYKGSTEMTQLVTPTRYHIANHQAWLNILKTYGHKFQKIHGIALTGWQRYENYFCMIFSF